MAEPAEQWTQAQTDAKAETIRLLRVDKDGVWISTRGRVVIKLADCVPSSGGNGKDIALREIDVCVDGVAKKMIVLCSLPYAAS